MAKPIKQEMQLLARTLRELPANSETKELLTRKQRAATLEEVGEAIAICEALSQVKRLTDEQRRALQKELYNMRFPPDELLARAKSVALNPAREFGNIGLRWWLEDTLASKRDVDRLVEAKLRVILSEGMLRLVDPSAKEVKESAVDRLLYEIERQREMAFQRALRATQKDFDKYVRMLRAMSYEERREMYNAAVEAGVFGVKDDEAMIKNLHKRYIAIAMYKAGVAVNKKPTNVGG